MVVYLVQAWLYVTMQVNQPPFIDFNDLLTSLKENRKILDKKPFVLWP